VHQLAVDIGATKIVVALTDAEGTILDSVKGPSSGVFGAKREPAAALEEVIRGFCEERGLGLSRLEGMGIGVPGVVDPASSTVVACPNLPALDGIQLGPQLQTRLGLPVWVENDVNLICLGEHLAGRGKGVANLACVYVGSGIGGGLVINGELYTGAHGSAGELGHSVIEPEGRACTCGSRGCLEMYCSGKALSLRARKVLGGEAGQAADGGRWDGAQAVIGAARKGHAAALRELRAAFYYLGLGIVNLVNIVNPQLVLLGGGIAGNWPEGLKIVRATVRERACSLAKDHTVFELAALGESAGLVGAAALVHQRAVLRK